MSLKRKKEKKMLGADTAFIDVRKKEVEKEEITLISDAYVNNSQVFPIG